MSRQPARRAALLVLSAVLCALALPTVSAVASEPRVAVASAAPVALGDRPLSRVITSSFDVVLARPHERALADFIASLSNTASRNYHRYLTPSQFARRFGATSASIDSVRSYLSSFGLDVGSLSRGHIILHVRGSTLDIAHAFATTVATVRRGASLHAQFTNTATLPARIARAVSGVVGLSNAPAPRPEAASQSTAHVALPSTCPQAGDASGTTPNSLGGYTVAQQAQLYGLSSQWSAGNTGVGQTIAIFELAPYATADTSIYFSCYGLSPQVTNISVDGGSPDQNNLEPTIDVEEAAALAPGAAIEVYTGPNNSVGPTDVYQQIADDNTAAIVSTSWGTCEADPTGDPRAEQAIFEQMATQGQTVLSASGDNGSSDCYGITNSQPAVDDPASQPLVTGVGALTVSSLAPLHQTVWNDGAGSFGGASGGGVSQLWSRPSWQNAPGLGASVTMRSVPDLSTMGDPSSGFVAYFTGSSTGQCSSNCYSAWRSIGGTSIGSPLVAALVAVAAQRCHAPRLGFLNPTLYTMARSGSGFVDVTQGTNDLYGVGAYSAGVGYDAASGLGSPSATTFIPGLCPAAFDATKSSLTAAGSPTTARPATLTLALRDTNNNPIANAQVHVSASASAGTIVIDEDLASSTSSGAAAYDVTTDALGTASISVVTDEPGAVNVSATYANQTLATTLHFAQSTIATVPGRATITRLVALVGGFRLSVRASASDGGSPLTSYQYSLDGGRRWVTFAVVSSGTTVASATVSVTKLARAKRYRVLARVRNAVGASAASAAVFVSTLKK